MVRPVVVEVDHQQDADQDQEIEVVADGADRAIVGEVDHVVVEADQKTDEADLAIANDLQRKLLSCQLKLRRRKSLTRKVRKKYCLIPLLSLQLTKMELQTVIVGQDQGRVAAIIKDNIAKEIIQVTLNQNEAVQGPDREKIVVAIVPGIAQKIVHVIGIAQGIVHEIGIAREIEIAKDRSANVNDKGSESTNVKENGVSVNAKKERKNAVSKKDANKSVEIGNVVSVSGEKGNGANVNARKNSCVVEKKKQQNDAVVKPKPQVPTRTVDKRNGKNVDHAAIPKIVHLIVKVQAKVVPLAEMRKNNVL